MHFDVNDARFTFYLLKKEASQHGLVIIAVNTFYNNCMDNYIRNLVIISLILKYNTEYNNWFSRTDTCLYFETCHSTAFH